jgi:hypothetical protein
VIKVNRVQASSLTDKEFTCSFMYAGLFVTA